MDSRALVTWAREEPYPQGWVWTAMAEGMVVIVPAVALALARAALYASECDVLQVLLSLPVAVVDDLDQDTADEVGRIMAEVADPKHIMHLPEAVALAHAARCARHRRFPILTGNPAGLRALDPDLDLNELP